ncbi:hypothetical protein LSTR_LSTR009650 [Laodelphax striatellus]|uniref:Uncharacterized protein n=1 Tax=Laodelphax striatellus TaxID=195883 RepID=A0A482WNJ1_LAOST|nr:hypothetical protein LSTR_LSTR009650 [Laodelphax striatellus]
MKPNIVGRGLDEFLLRTLYSTKVGVLQKCAVCVVESEDGLGGWREGVYRRCPGQGQCRCRYVIGGLQVFFGGFAPLPTWPARSPLRLFPYFVSISTSFGMPITYNGVSHDVATTFLRRRLLSSQWLTAAKTAAKNEMMIANEVFD